MVGAKPSTTGSPQWPESAGRVTWRAVEGTVGRRTTTTTAIAGRATARVVSLIVHGCIGEARRTTVGVGVLVVVVVVVVAVAIAVYSVPIQLCEV